MKIRALMMACISMPLMIYAQNHVQTFRGTVYEQETLMPLIGANVLVEHSDLGTSTDGEGQFTIPNVPVGRHNIIITYLGYEPLVINHVLLTTGKEFTIGLPRKLTTIPLQDYFPSSITGLNFKSLSWRWKVYKQMLQPWIIL